MKKIFLAALMAMSLCSYSYAQDDDDEYEEDSPRAVAESTTSSSLAALHGFVDDDAVHAGVHGEVHRLLDAG